MLSVPTGWTAEERDNTRKIAQSFQVAWKKQYQSTIRIFTIGISTIGGPDVINSSGGITSDWNKYIYEDESNNVLSLSYEQELQQPIGGISKALADIKLDNTSGRYTPRYNGGSSALFTSVYKPRRPFIINGGFNYNGVDNLIPQFVGLTTKPPLIDSRNKTIEMAGGDFVDFLQNKFVDTEAMFTGLRTDQIIENLLINAGYGTSQYQLDYGINIVPFAEMKPGDKFGDLINKLVQAENGLFWQDQEGKLHFQNRQAWDSSPYTTVQRVINTAMVIDAQVPNTDHLINVVEVVSKPRAKQINQLVFSLSGTKELPALTDTEIFVNFDDPMLSLDNPVYIANTIIDGTGTDVTTSISLKSYSKFARSAKIVLRNNTSSTAFITSLTVYGRPAKVSTDIYYREQRDASVTAYEERPYKIENEYIGNASWAASFAGMVLNDYSQPENLTEITIRAIPELQMGDLISWQGRYWRVFGIKSKIDPSSGYVQTLKLLQRTIQTYFRIGISTIGGSDKIAP